MPQFDISTYSSQIFWLVVCFGLTFLGLSKLVLPHYKKILEKRILKLEKDIESTVYLQKEIVKLKMNRMDKLNEAEKKAEEDLKKVESQIISEQKSLTAMLQKNHDKEIKKLNESLDSQKIFILENLDSFIEDCSNDLMEKYFPEEKKG